MAKGGFRCMTRETTHAILYSTIFFLLVFLCVLVVDTLLQRKGLPMPSKKEIAAMGKDPPVEAPTWLKFVTHVEDNRERVQKNLEEMPKSSGLWVWAINARTLEMFRVIRNGAGDRYVADLSTTYTYNSWRLIWTPIAIVFRPMPIMEEGPV